MALNNLICADVPLRVHSLYPHTVLLLCHIFLSHCLFDQWINELYYNNFLVFAFIIHVLFAFYSYVFFSLMMPSQCCRLACELTVLYLHLSLDNMLMYVCVCIRWIVNLSWNLMDVRLYCGLLICSVFLRLLHGMLTICRSLFRGSVSLWRIWYSWCCRLCSFCRQDDIEYLQVPVRFVKFYIV